MSSPAAGARETVRGAPSVGRPADDELVGSLVRRATDLARAEGLAERGFRLVFNYGEDAGYSVYHVHLHLVGGRKLGWPPG